MQLRILIVDDETPARAHMRQLVRRCTLSAPPVIAEAAQASDALQLLAKRPADLLLLDIQMPEGDGVALARELHGRPDAPAVVFVTGHPSHAVAAFELDAVDYLTKPVRAERLQQALQKTLRHLQGRPAQRPVATVPEPALLIRRRDRVERVPLADVLYLKSERKYLTVHTATRRYVFSGSLSAVERAHPGHFIRTHRHTLVARPAMCAMVLEGDEHAGWVLRIEANGAQLAVARRQSTCVRRVLEAST